MYRSSAGDLTFKDDPPMRGGERWDRDRFERMRVGSGSKRSPPGREDEHLRFQEHDSFPGGRRGIDFHEDYQRRGPRVTERERFREEDVYDRPNHRRTELFEETTPSEIANRALAPYRRKSVVGENIDVAVRRPARPQYIRRQSSLDTFDRRPLPRYGELERIDRIERDEWRPPTNIPIPLPFRERRHSPSRHYRDEEFEETRYRDADRESRRGRQEVEEFREVEVERKRSKVRRSRSQAARSIAQSVRSSSSSSFEEVPPAITMVGKRGKTRMPKRLVKKQAVIELGYPFEEEDDFIIVKRALEKEHIDEIIRISENYKEEKTTYVYEDIVKKELIEVAPPPLPPPEVFVAAPPPPPASMHYAQSIRAISPSRHGHEVYEEEIRESAHIGGPLTVLVPPEERRVVRHERDVVRSERDIKEEIRALEAERRALKYERENDYEFIDRKESRREVIRVDKDRKVRKGPNPKIVAAMIGTLS